MVLRANATSSQRHSSTRNRSGRTSWAVKAAGGKSVEGKKVLDTVTTLADQLKRRSDKLEKGPRP
jgi:hypothetical protein